MIQLWPYRTPKGNTAVIACRDDTVDMDIATSSIQQDEYRLGPHERLNGWAIDVGAHIGAVTVALALDNPDLRVLAVEIVPENIAMLRMNLERNGVADRVTVVDKAAGGPDELSRTCYMYHRSHPVATTEYVNKHRFIGNSFFSMAYEGAFDSEAVDIGTTSLDGLMAEHGIDEVEFLKTDCEGCEWAFLQTPAIAKVKYVIGEYHWDYAPQGDLAVRKEGTILHKRENTAQAELHAMFDATHILEVDEHPTIGLFTAVRR